MKLSALPLFVLLSSSVALFAQDPAPAEPTATEEAPATEQPLPESVSQSGDSSPQPPIEAPATEAPAIEQPAAEQPAAEQPAPESVSRSGDSSPHPPADPTDIFVAIHNNNMEQFEQLLAAQPGTILSVRLGNGDTPLHRAALADRMEMSYALLKHGADPNAANATGWTPLHYAVTTNSLDCIRLLLNAQANPQAEAKGWTPLLLAARFGFSEAAQLFLDKGTDAASVRRAAEVARKEGHEDMAAWLLSRCGADPLSSAGSTVDPTAPDPSTFRQWVDFDRSVFRGQARNGKAHGYCTMKMLDGSHYEGYWRKGVRTGTGTFTYANGNRYTGNWKNDVPHGDGHFEFANGGHVEGTWRNGRIWKASGVLVDAKDVRYSCLWEKGECVSQMPQNPAAE